MTISPPANKMEIKMDIIEIAKTRYSTKAFDAAKSISPETFEKIEELLRLSPSSTNAQPWHFLLISSKEAKLRLAKATEGNYAFNKSKILDAPCSIVFTTRTTIDEDYLLKIVNKENDDGRFKTEEDKMAYHERRSYFVNLHNEAKDTIAWNEKQVYLNLGNFLLGVKALGLDAVPMEGFDSEILEDEFGLKEKGLKSSIIVAIGHHREDDFNFKLPKSRLDINDIITRY